MGRHEAPLVADVTDQYRCVTTEKLIANELLYSRLLDSSMKLHQTRPAGVSLHSYRECQFDVHKTCDLWGVICRTHEAPYMFLLIIQFYKQRRPT